MFTSIKDFFERNKNKRAFKFGAPAIFLVTSYFLWLPENYKLQFRKRIKDDNSMREYGSKDDK